MFEAHFQTFEEPEAGVALTARLAALREELARRKLTGFVVPRADQQQNEYVPPSRRAAGLADRLYRLGRAGDRADAGGRDLRRRPLHAAGGQAGRRQGWAVGIADRSAAGELVSAASRRPATASASIRGCTLRRQPSGSPAACAKAGAELVAGRQQPGRRGLADRPQPPLGAGRPARPAICRRRRGRQARRGSRARSPSSAPTRWCCPTATPSPGPSTSAAPTSRIRRCRWPSRWCRRTAGRPCSSTTASSPISTRDHLEQSADVREPDALAPTLMALGQERRRDRARQRHRGRRAQPADRERRRQGGARQRSDRAAQGRQERDRDRRHADGAPPRRRGAGALPRLVRPRGAKRQADRDRRGRGAGDVPPRHRRAEGRVVPDHLRRRPERRHRALPRHPQEQPAHRAGRPVPDRFRRAI